MKIFGINYKIKYLKKQNEYMEGINALGYCDFNKKEIYILDTKNKELTLLHELIHAHFYESGNETYACDEQLVEVTTNIFNRIKKL